MGIYNLGGGGGAPELQAKEATPLITNAQQIILPDEGYDGLSKVTVNPMPTGTLKTPTVNSIGYVSSGVQTAGYLNTTATSGLQLSTQGSTTITPGISTKTAVASGKYTTGNVYVAGDANLAAQYIIAGRSIFNVNGAASGFKVLSAVAYGNGTTSQTVTLDTMFPNSAIGTITPTWFGIFVSNFGSSFIGMFYTTYTNKDFSSDLYYSDGEYYGSSSLGCMMFGHTSSASEGPIQANCSIKKISNYTWVFNLNTVNSYVLTSGAQYRFVIVGI